MRGRRGREPPWSRSCRCCGRRWRYPDPPKSPHCCPSSAAGPTRPRAKHLWGCSLYLHSYSFCSIVTPNDHRLFNKLALKNAQRSFMNKKMSVEISAQFFRAGLKWKFVVLGTWKCYILNNRNRAFFPVKWRNKMFFKGDDDHFPWQQVG